MAGHLQACAFSFEQVESGENHASHEGRLGGPGIIGRICKDTQ